MCVERQNLHNNNDKHWNHWIRIRWWVSRAISLWSLEDRICSINKKAIDKSLWQTKRLNYHSRHLFKNDYSRTHKKSYLYVNHQTWTTNFNTRKIMNAQARDQLWWKDEHHRILFRILHLFEKDKDDDDVIVKQRKKHFFREEIFFKSIKSLEIRWVDQRLERIEKERH